MDRSLKTMFLAILLIPICAACLSLPAFAASLTFSDVPDDAWYKKYVDICVDLGIVDGLPDGSFQPSASITRGEFIRMLACSIGGSDVPDTDCAVHWSEGYWKLLDEAGVLSGTGIKCDNASLEQLITRGEMAMLLSNAIYKVMGEPQIELENPNSYLSDLGGMDPNYIYAAIQAYGKGLITGYADRSFRADISLTRAEAAAVISRLADSSLRIPPDKNKHKWDGTFDSGTLFIGDSITYHLITKYLKPKGLIGEASYMAAANSGLPHFCDSSWGLKPAKYNGYGCVYSPEFYNLSFSQAISKSSGKYTSVYFLMGSNGSGQVTQDAYEKIIGLLLEAYPDATIYMQTVPTCKTGTVSSARVNSCVEAAVKTFGDKGINNVVLLDTNSIWDNSCIMSDGVHLTDTGLKKWFEFIVDNR